MLQLEGDQIDGPLRSPRGGAAPQDAVPVRWGWSTFALTFVGVAVLLLIRSHDLFTKFIIEEGDNAANSILVEHAKHFTQLVGNYSRMDFYHPGPAFLYIQAFGEWACYDVLGLVPTPWNGQAIAVLLFNAAVLAVTVTIVDRSLRSRGVATMWSLAATVGVALLFLGAHPDVITSTWPPFEYFAPYLLLLAAATSVAVGGTRDLWALALADGLLMHGHAEFLVLSNLVVLAAVVSVLRRERGHVRAFLATRRRHLVVAGSVIAIFLMPIALNLVLHWPGEFGKYLAYGGSTSPNAPWSAAWYVLRVWVDSPYAAAALVAAVVAAGWAVRSSRHPFVRAGLGVAAVAIGSFLVYAIVGIDSLNERYIGYFTHAIPLFVLLISVAVAVGEAAGARPQRRWLAAGLAVTGVVTGMMSPALTNTRFEVSDAPAALDVLASRTAPNQPIVIHLAPTDAWAEAVPLALTGHRRGMRLCLDDRELEVLATPAYLCTADELAAGVHVTIARRGTPPPGMQLIAELNRSQVWVGPLTTPAPR